MSNQALLCGSYIYAGGITPEACQKIDFHRITHLFIAFSVLEEEKGLYMPVIPAETAAGMEIIRQECTRQHAECKILLSVGGAECSIDTPDTIREKAAYYRDRGFGGIFCWQETTDYRGELRKAMFDSLQ